MVITNLEHLSSIARENSFGNLDRHAPRKVKGGIGRRSGVGIEAKAISRAAGNVVAVTATAAVTAALSFSLDNY
ncbi:hypothetical protein V0288_20520 [Pannus brasiliensis CCIBt3594]|uniref:Uncharacterized protein n=1 Tax=Pannus brasiliensis CCIBt3594 TaxID=1427578 RepID=A0AAW9R0Z2_9CHRO